jgi:hypothetical protein
MANTSRPAAPVEGELVLSVWDALMVGRVSATRPGLRARLSDVSPVSTAPVAKCQEVV